jgi:predicted porin
MKKTQVALAALALVASTAVLADGVTVYGALDAGMVSGGGDADAKTHFAQGEWSGNLWGVRGSSDLGNGMKAGFNLEQGFSTGNGNVTNGGGNGGFNRLSNITLSGNFGTLTAGRQFSPQVGQILSNLPQTMAGFHVPFLALAGALDNQNGTAASTFDSSVSGGFFTANAVSYTGGGNGVTVTALSAMKDALGLGGVNTFSASTSFGGANVSASYSEHNAAQKVTSIGGNTTIGDLKIGANYINAKATTTSTAIVTTSIGASYPIAAATSLGVNYAVNDATTKASVLNFNLAYSLAPTTTLWVFYNDAQGAAYSSYSGLQDGTTNTGRYGGTGGSSFGAGVAHNF